MQYWSLAAIIISLIIVIVLALKGVKIILIAPVAAVAVAMLSNVNGLAAFTITYMQSFGNYIISNFPIFMVGAIFGLFMDKSGYAQALAQWIVQKLGSKRGLLAIVVSTAILVYGGVSLFVVVFTIYPIAANICKEADIPKRLIPGAIGLGAFGFAAYALPGSPQVQNAMFMPYYQTNLYAAPVLGVIGAVLMFCMGMIWLNGRLKKAWEKGEGYGDHEENLSEISSDSHIGFIKALSPILVFFVLNLVFTYVLFPSMDGSFLEAYGTTLSSVTGTWSLVLALLIASIYIVILNYSAFKGMILNMFADGITSAVLPITNTAAVIGYGGVIKTLAGFAIVSSLLLGISKNPLIAEVISINVLSGITGSASGGIGITLEAFADQFIQMAESVNISLPVMHRIGLIASCGLDSLPHNGAIVTTLAVCGLTHKQSYGDMFVTTCCIPLITVAILIVLATLGIQC